MTLGFATCLLSKCPNLSVYTMPGLNLINFAAECHYVIDVSMTLLLIYSLTSL